MDMTAFGDRIKLARKHARLSQVKLCKAVGISQGTLSEMENTGMSSTYTVQIASACGVSPEWLATGDGEMSASSHRGQENVTRVTSSHKVPLISWQQAGALQGALDVYEPAQVEEWIDSDDDTRGAYALRVVNDSMVSPYPTEQSFPAGSVIVVHRAVTAAHGDYVIARDPSTGQATFKLLAHDAGRWFLRPLNAQAYPTTEIQSPASCVIGKVVEVVIRRKL